MIYSKTHVKFFCFLCVGGFSAVVNFGSFTAMWHYLHWPNALSVTVSYFLSVLVHFLGNRYITFHETKHQPLWDNLKKYGVMVFINYFISLLIVHVGVNNFHLLPPLTVVISIIVTVGLGFLLSKKWVFKI